MATRLRAAILDDYQNVALRLADWSALSDVDIKVFTQPFASRQAATDALQDFEIVVGMRERTPFPRATIAALPKLKLLITTGAKNNSFDLKAAADHGVTVCGTGTVGAPTVGITFGLMLELTRRIGFENQRMKAGEPWQVTLGRDLEGLTLGVVGFGKLGHRVAAVAQAFGMKVIAWSQNLTPEDAEKAGVRYATKNDSKNVRPRSRSSFNRCCISKQGSRRYNAEYCCTLVVEIGYVTECKAVVLGRREPARFICYLG